MSVRTQIENTTDLRVIAISQFCTRNRISGDQGFWSNSPGQRVLLVTCLSAFESLNKQPPRRRRPALWRGSCRRWTRLARPPGPLDCRGVGADGESRTIGRSNGWPRARLCLVPKGSLPPLGGSRNSHLSCTHPSDG